ncbi:MAG TPA: DUF167 domain-containing protein [Thermodesulfovibrionales bacterium]|nr:DUF167 domain-containing protein [Thermodesulfovibrionales bacterium]
MIIPYKKSKGGVLLNVRVQPRSSRKGIEIVDDVIRVRLTAPPAGGAANEQLVEILSETLGIRKGCFRIVRGVASRSKVIEVKGVDVL